MQYSIRVVVIGAFLGLTYVPWAAWAVGGANIANEVPSARAAGQGYVGTAGQNDDPTIAYSNPAGMTKLPGTQATYGFHWENLHSEFENANGEKTKMRSTDAFIPNFSISHKFNERVSAGFSSQSPYGLETHWPGDSPLRYVATDSRLRTIVLTPAVAIRLHDMVSIGFGLNYINVFNAQLDRHVSADVINAGAGSPTAGAPDVISSLKGKGDAFGFTTGLLVEPSPHHAIGLAFRSKMKVRLNGNLRLSGFRSTDASAAVFGGGDYETSVYTDLNIPANFQAGYAFKPSGRLMLETDVSWMHWSSGRDLNVRFAETNATRRAFLSAGNPSKFDLRDTWNVAAGANYKATEKMQIRGGLWYEPWAIAETNFNPSFMDLSRLGASTGLGYAINDSVSIDVAYSASFFMRRSIHNDLDTATGTSSSVDGTYRNFANLVAANVTYKFGKR